MMMRIDVQNNIRVHDADVFLKHWCVSNLVLDNPEYHKKVRMGKWIGGTPSTISLYESRGNDLVIPFGCISKIWNMFPDKALWDIQICPKRPVSYASGIKLYPYQETAVNEAIRKRNGVLVMPCGSGKTQSGIEIIARLGGKALWLTHTQDLLNQSMNRAKNVLSGAGLGTITAGKVNIGTHITFATVQTMVSLDLSQYKDEWDIIVVDECQHCCGSPTRVTQFYKVVSSLSARYKYGLTATPKRADGLEKAMFVLLGDILHEVTREEVAHTTCPIHVEQIRTGWFPDCDCVLMGDGTIDYSKVIDNMVNDKQRFNFVLDRVEKCNGGCLVLANRVEYLQRMNEQYHGKSMCLSGMGQSKAAKAERKEALRKLNEGELQCIFATYQLAKEGLDVPSLRYVVLATPEKDETTVVQSVGRVGRKADGKEFGTVIDFVDDFGMYKGWSKKRAGFYKKIGAEVHEQTYDRGFEISPSTADGDES